MYLGYKQVYKLTEVKPHLITQLNRTGISHSNPLCRMTTLDLFRQEELNYDKQKYREVLLEATEPALGYFDFDRTIYDAESARKTNRKVV